MRGDAGAGAGADAGAGTGAAAGAGAGDPGRPALRVISGDATDEEIAAVLAVVAAAQQAAVARAARLAAASRGSGRGSAWADRSRALRGLPPGFTPGPDAWRTSAWPR